MVSTLLTKRQTLQPNTPKSQLKGLTRNSHLWSIISDWLTQQIIDGTFIDGEKLPSIRSLANQFNVSLTTVQRALSHIERQGMIQTVSQLGCFVISSQVNLTEYDFSGVDININKAVASMLSDAGRPDFHSLGSAVLNESLAPEVLLKRCLAVVSRDVNAISSFSSPPGNLDLRKQISGLMIRRGVMCLPEDVIITAGDTVAMELSLMAAGKEGDRVIVEEPTYFGILQAIEHVKMRAVPIKICPAQGIDIDVVQEALQNGSYAAIFLNPTLHNPCGFVMPAHQRDRLVKIAALSGVTIIEDDVFSDLLPFEHRIPAIKSFDSENVIYCSSFTKTIAPGFRVGWCVPGKYKDAVLAQMFSRNLSVSCLPQMVLAEFLGRGYLDEHLIRLRKSLQISSEKLKSILLTHFPSGLVYHQPVAGFVHWIELPKTVDMEKFHYLVKKANIGIANGSIFSARGKMSHNLRICLTKRFSKEIHALIAQLGVCAIEASNPI